MRKAAKRKEIRRRAPVQERSRASVAAILDASARILKRDGAAGFNTNRVAEVAGVSVGSLYGYFPDKSAIMLALARRIFEEDDKALKKVLSESKGSPVRAIVRSMLEQHGTNRELRRIVMGHHIGQGFRGEHGERTQSGARQIAENLASRNIPVADPVRFFVVTRAVLGVCRTLVEEPEGSIPPVDQIGNELVRLVQLCLG